MATASNRQKEILRLAGQGLSYGEIANQMGVKTGTVKTQVHRVIGKLGAKNLTHAVTMTLQEQYKELIAAFFPHGGDYDNSSQML